MTFGPAVGNVGMYVAREMLISVPEDQRQAYLRMVEEISDLKYQLGVEVARQLPRLLAEADPERVARYLAQVREVVEVGELDPEVVVTPSIYVDRVVAV